MEGASIILEDLKHIRKAINRKILGINKINGESSANRQTLKKAEEAIKLLAVQKVAVVYPV